MTGNAELIERQAWNCDEWPGWLHEVVAETNEVADRLDMSAEQAHAYAALTALRSQPAGVKVRGLAVIGDQDWKPWEGADAIVDQNGNVLAWTVSGDEAKQALLSALEPAILSKQGGER